MATNLYYILQDERITQTMLCNTIKKQVEEIGEKPVPMPNLNRLINGKKTRATDKTFVKILNALNELRKRPREYKLDEIT